MTSQQLSNSITLRAVAGTLAGITIGLGINAILRPRTALELLQFQTPATAGDRKLVDNLMRIYGARNIAMGLATGITAYFGHTKALAWISIGNSVTAIVDGFATKDQNGRGEWNHWGFVSVSLGMGAALLGAFDRVSIK